MSCKNEFSDEYTQKNDAMGQESQLLKRETAKNERSKMQLSRYVCLLSVFFCEIWSAWKNP